MFSSWVSLWAHQDEKLDTHIKSSPKLSSRIIQKLAQRDDFTENRKRNHSKLNSSLDIDISMKKAAPKMNTAIRNLAGTITPRRNVNTGKNIKPCQESLSTSLLKRNDSITTRNLTALPNNKKFLTQIDNLSDSDKDNSIKLSKYNGNIKPESHQILKKKPNSNNFYDNENTLSNFNPTVIDIEKIELEKDFKSCSTKMGTYLSLNSDKGSAERETIEFNVVFKNNNSKIFSIGSQTQLTAYQVYKDSPSEGDNTYEIETSIIPTYDEFISDLKKKLSIRASQNDVESFATQISDATEIDPLLGKMNPSNQLLSKISDNFYQFSDINAFNDDVRISRLSENTINGCNVVDNMFTKGLTDKNKSNMIVQAASIRTNLLNTLKKGTLKRQKENNN